MNKSRVDMVKEASSKKEEKMRNYLASHNVGSMTGR
jgi:hypothetical protein